jgi:myb proto-oncogene protein
MKSIVFNIEKTKKRVSWTEQEDSVLISLVQSRKRKNWKKISRIIGNKSEYQCSLRYRSINPSLRKGAWEPAEDKKILDAIKVHGKKWNKIAAAAFTDRNAKQIRDRYINYLDPEIVKDKFTPDEDLLILDLHNKHGNKWSFIRQFIPHRSSDMIKNRYNSSISRNKKLFAVLRTLNQTENVSLTLMPYLLTLFILRDF